MSIRRAPDRGFSFEYLLWIFTRLSGLGMIMLGLLGMVMAFYYGARTQIDLPTLLRWMFFPNQFHINVEGSEIPDLLVWTSGIWQIMQTFIVFFGVSHGVNGLRVVIEDYTGPTIGRLILRFLLFMIWGFVLFVAVYIIWKV